MMDMNNWKDCNIVAECESDDMDVAYWCKLPKVIAKTR